MAEERTPRELGPDGISRTAEAERILNGLFVAVFNNPEGKQVLDYLRAYTLNRINGPEVSGRMLRHHEGMRFLFHVIAARIERGIRQ